MLWNRLNSIPRNQQGKIIQIKSSKLDIKFADEMKGFDVHVEPKVSLHMCKFMLPDNTELQFKISNN